LQANPEVCGAWIPADAGGAAANLDGIDWIGRKSRLTAWWPVRTAAVAGTDPTIPLPIVPIASAAPIMVALAQPPHAIDRLAINMVSPFELPNPR
jgi:hypothetical protein